jgi:hypothetical protein
LRGLARVTNPGHPGPLGISPRWRPFLPLKAGIGACPARKICGHVASRARLERQIARRGQLAPARAGLV